MYNIYNILYIQIIYKQNEILGSSITFKLDDNQAIVQDEIKQFTMEKSDQLIPCSNDENKNDENRKECQSSNGEKCEL